MKRIEVSLVAIVLGCIVLFATSCGRDIPATTAEAEEPTQETSGQIRLTEPPKTLQPISEFYNSNNVVVIDMHTITGNNKAYIGVGSVWSQLPEVSNANEIGKILKAFETDYNGSVRSVSFERVQTDSKVYGIWVDFMKTK